MAIPVGAPDWQGQILTGVGAPITPQNLQALAAWQRGEGGTANNNPFNTTWQMPGATPYNTLPGGGHVYNYLTPAQGINATIRTLHNGLYAPILRALQAGTNSQAVAQAIANSQWGTGGRALTELPYTPAPRVPVYQGVVNRLT